MFSITLKRSVTTVAVMAGLLAVAGPAGASSAYGFMDYTDDALVFWGESSRHTQASLGRENSIECLLRAKASDEGQTQSRSPAPPNITLCHEGFEIQ